MWGKLFIGFKRVLSRSLCCFHKVVTPMAQDTKEIPNFSCNILHLLVSFMRGVLKLLHPQSPSCLVCQPFQGIYSKFYTNVK